MEYERVKYKRFKEFVAWYNDNVGELNSVSNTLIYRVDYYDKDSKKVCYQHVHRVANYYIKRELYKTFLKSKL